MRLLLRDANVRSMQFPISQMRRRRCIADTLPLLSPLPSSPLFGARLGSIVEMSGEDKDSRMEGMFCYAMLESGIEEEKEEKPTRHETIRDDTFRMEEQPRELQLSVRIREVK